MQNLKYSPKPKQSSGYKKSGTNSSQARLKVRIPLRKLKLWAPGRSRHKKYFYKIKHLWGQSPVATTPTNYSAARSRSYFRKLGRLSRRRAVSYFRKRSRRRRLAHIRMYFALRRRKVLGIRFGRRAIFKKFILGYSKLTVFRHQLIRAAARSDALVRPQRRRSAFSRGFFSGRPVRQHVIKFLKPTTVAIHKVLACFSRRGLTPRVQSNPATNKQSLTVRPHRRYLKRYLRKLWRLALRIKFERFLFTKLGRPVYVWFHSVWSLYFRKFRKWRLSTIRFMMRAQARKRKKAAVPLRFSMLRLILRTVGVLSTVSGSLHCFAHVLGFLMQRFRQHFQLLRIVRRFLVRARRKFRTIHFCRIIIVGKFGGAMRARKFLMKIGHRGKFLLVTRRLQYVMIHSHTRWGVFGIRIWTHVIRRPYYFKSIWETQRPGFTVRQRALSAFRNHNVPLLGGKSFTEILGNARLTDELKPIAE